MTRNNRTSAGWAVFFVGIAAAAAVMLFWLRKPAAQETQAAAPAADTGGIVPFRMEQQWLVRLKMAVAEEAELAPQIRSIGRVIPVPANRVVVSPPVGGIVADGDLPQIGDHVRRGQILATLIQTPTAAEAAQIRIENIRIDAERRRLAQAEIEARARLNAAAAEAERARRLLEKKAYSQRQLEISEAEHKATEANLGAIQEQLRALQTSPTTSTYELKAPISGTVVMENKSAGERVGPGEPVFEIVDLDTVWVEAPIFEKDLGRLSKSNGVTFRTAAFPDREFHGRLVTLGSVIDEQTRAAKALFEVSNKTGELRIGMQADVRLDAGSKEKVLLVPREAVLDNEGKKIVYVMRSGEEFERRDVVLGDEYGSKLAVISGVKQGERVVTQGAYQLKLQELRPANAGAHTHEV
jgi:RND family efflux transporter MFP subunit